MIRLRLVREGRTAVVGRVGFIAVEQVDSARIPTWLLLALVVVGGFGAAFTLMVYVANGMVVGDLIGLRGREHDIAIAQHRGRVGLLSCVLLQFGVAGALFSYVDRENGYINRIFWCARFSRCDLGVRRRDCALPENLALIVRLIAFREYYRPWGNCPKIGLQGLESLRENWLKDGV